MTKSVDPALEAHPTLFRRERSTALVLGFGIVAVLFIIGFALSLVFFEQIAAFAMEDTGRRSGMKGIAVPGLVGLTAVFAALFIALTAAASYRWVHLPSGSVLSGRFRNIDVDETDARAWRDGFQADAAHVYPQLPSRDTGDVRVAVYVAKPFRTAFVTVTRPSADFGLDIATVTDDAYDRLMTAMGRG